MPPTPTTQWGFPQSVTSLLRHFPAQLPTMPEAMYILTHGYSDNSDTPPANPPNQNEMP